MDTGIADPATREAIKNNRARLDNLEKIVYLGNGQPPLTARLAALERATQTQTWLIRSVLGGVIANLLALGFLLLRSGAAH